MSEISNPVPMLEQALALVTADHAEASFNEAREASTRFANNRITQNVSRREANLTVKVAFGQQVGRASVTDFSREGLQACVARAEAIARASAPDTE